MKLVTFETISQLLPIEGADRIELARIQGWQSVVKKGEYKIGDRVIFIPIDTVIEPADWNRFLQDKKDPTKPIRVKTAKLRGAISQGVIFPTSITDTTEEEQLPEVLKVSKYERPMSLQLAGLAKGFFPSHLVSRTDEDNLKSNIEVLEELRKADLVEVTVKIDGTSATYIKELDGTFRVCSRNLELKDTESNVHWQMARKYNIQDKLEVGYAIQGEISGPGIQGNPAGYDEVNLKIFNVFDLQDRRPLARDRWDLAFTDIPYVDHYGVLFRDEFAKMSIDDLQVMTNKLLYDNQEPAEGLVFRGIKNGKLMYSETLHKMLSVKIINQNFKESE